MAKRKGYRIFIHGNNFLKSEEITAQFCWNSTVTKTCICIFKNPKLLAAQIPDMGAEVPEGDHLVSVDITLNGQQFSACEGIQFLYKSVDPNLTEEELKKMDEDDAKGAKGKAGKKK
uniref:IPT/TIG domain-containing protein n=1 Tax=Strombidium rassoulzadegani TaxID=1082188 RepID=A0A7S3CU68_9SPIT|mmetsp:Transcript_6155/g.10446  ORF Transcript_6155/g.10446 Transcript_6155/m.10446 type:complete len:117 (+) Transcript_6155:180-530(+)